jgi:gliding motility-associated-like protein
MRKLFLPLLLIANLAFGQVDLNLGLRAYYPFSVNANDVSGNNNNPVFNNATLTADRFGNPNSAYHFNGTDNYMQIPNSASLNMPNKMSVALWVKATGYYTGPCYNNMLVTKSATTTLPSNFYVRFADVYNGCTAPTTIDERFSGNNTVAPTPLVQLNEWYSVVWTSDGVLERIYVNCVLKVTALASGVPFSNGLDMFFGKQNSGAFPYWLNGDLDEIRIYDRALNQDEVSTLGGCTLTTPCNNWLKTLAVGQHVTVGDLDISGNQVTVEANFNCSSFPINRPDKQQDIVSKHANTTDINYVLRMDLAGITTSTGQHLTPLPCDNLVLNKTYHVAMVYDGITLKFYRNGFLMSQTPATGNLILNNWQTTIGDYAVNNPVGTNFLGYINEVRIWNVARTQAQIQTYMNTSLPNPATQTGLQAYYTFENLVNKQGNQLWNGTLNGGATINNTNPNCSFVADSCAVTASSVIINAYTPVLALNPCNNTLTVEDGTAYNVGDTVLLIQMKGAVIDSTNTAASGTVTDYKNSGNYEYNYVKSKTGNAIELKNALTRQYDIPVGKVQLIRVPYYTDLTTTDTLTCLPWDGSKGGVLVFNVQNTLTLGADLNVSGKGFKGGVGYNPGNASLTCNQNNYNYTINTLLAAQKGESITSISNNIICGKGNLAGGGGGGLGHNSGGGGGGNGGPGGFGGYQLDNCGGAPFDNRGIGGSQLAYSTASNRIFMGSGGGAGHADNPGNTPPAGGNGAGIIIVNADKIQANSKKIIANGDNGLACSAPSPNCHDAMGGGGAGGTVLLSVNQYLDNSVVENKGGKGADVVTGNIAAAGRIGPGGGGGGGLAFLKSVGLPTNLAITNTGGLNGVLTQDGNNPWGAMPGTAGQNLFNLVLPIDNVPFKTNIDSVRIKDSLLNCNGFDFKGLAYTNTAPIANWQWYFGDGGQAATQNTSHAYAAAGLYTVKLIVTDINGCTDSTSTDVNALPGVNAEAGPDTSICTNGTVSVTLNGTAVGGPYLWSPAIYLNNPNIQNPIATISSTTTFYLNVTGSASCTSIDSVTIYINPLPLVNTRPDTAICHSSPLVLNTISNAVSYQWSPAVYVSNPNIASPNYIDNFSHRVYVTGTSALGCKATDSLDVTVNPLPIVQTIADTTLCQSVSITLTTTGAQTYSWTPATGLSNPAIASPVFNGNNGQTYTVTGTDANGCKNTDLVIISVILPGTFKAPPAFTICQKQSVQLDGNNGNQVSYLWSPATYLSNATIINPLANPPQTTVYTLVVTDNRCGYDSTFTTLLTVVPAPVINARKSNDIDCAFKSATLFASGGNQYVWSPATGLSNPNISSPLATPINTQTYTVLVTNITGCSNTDSVTIFIKKAASLARYMPNAFTPDGNGINDCYGLKNWMYIQKLQFFIFNRYGEQVFAASNPNTCWDGMYKGKPALAGTYVYVIKAQTDCGTEEQKGSFILMR